MPLSVLIVNKHATSLYVSLSCATLFHSLCLSHPKVSLSLSLSLSYCLCLWNAKKQTTQAQTAPPPRSLPQIIPSLSLSLSLSRNTQYTHQNASLLRSTLDVGLSRRVRVGRLLSPSPSGEVLPFNSPCRGRPAQSQRQS